MATQRICSIEGCGKPVRNHGWCNAHYQRVLRHGSTDARKAPNGAGMAFLAQAITSETDECIVWPYGKANGYGRIFLGHKTYPAHRYVCEKAHGAPTPPATYACHSCAVPACVNPRHLRWGTNTDNYWDMVQHGNRNMRLNEVLVAQIKRSTLSKKALAQTYGVSVSTIKQIRSGKNWKHVA